jgi:PhnB protein
MASIKAYLGFPGTCAQAMEFYKGCFGGTLSVMRVKDTPVAAQMPAEQAGLVMHSSLVSGDLVLFACDNMRDASVSFGNGIALMRECDSEEDARQVIDTLHGRPSGQGFSFEVGDEHGNAAESMTSPPSRSFARDVKDALFFIATVFRDKDGA